MRCHHHHHHISTVALSQGGISSGPISYLLVHFCTNVLIPSCRNRGVVQVVEPGIGRVALRIITAGDKWKGERGAHQATGQATVQWCPSRSSADTYINGEKLVNVKQPHAQIAAVSKALAELELSGDKELMQPLESRLAELKARLHGARPIGQQVDGLRGVISRC